VPWGEKEGTSGVSIVEQALESRGASSVWCLEERLGGKESTALGIPYKTFPSLNGDRREENPVPGERKWMDHRNQLVKSIHLEGSQKVYILRPGGIRNSIEQGYPHCGENNRPGGLNIKEERPKKGKLIGGSKGGRRKKQGHLHEKKIYVPGG